MHAGSSTGGSADLMFQWTDQRGLYCRSSFRPGPDGTFHAAVPAGEGVLHRLARAADGRSPASRGWEELRELSVPAGETVELDPFRIGREMSTAETMVI